MSNEGKLIAALIAVYLYFHWRTVKTALASGMTGAAGNSTPGWNTTGSTDNTSGAGNWTPRGTAFPETWGTVNV